MTATSAIDVTGWWLMAWATVMLVGAALYLLRLGHEPLDLADDDGSVEHVQQPVGYRVLGPVRPSPYDWSTAEEVDGSGYTRGTITYEQQP